MQIVLKCGNFFLLSILHGGLWRLVTSDCKELPISSVTQENHQISVGNDMWAFKGATIFFSQGPNIAYTGVTDVLKVDDPERENVAKPHFVAVSLLAARRGIFVLKSRKKTYLLDSTSGYWKLAFEGRMYGICGFSQSCGSKDIPTEQRSYDLSDFQSKEVRFQCTERPVEGNKTLYTELIEKVADFNPGMFARTLSRAA